MEIRFNNEIKIWERLIGKWHPALFIADVWANFDGSLKKAKELALACKEAWADVFKIQSFLAPKIVSWKWFASMQLKWVHGSWNKPVDEVFKAAEFPRERHAEIMDYCNSIGILFTSSPYDYEAVDLLDSINVPFFKIWSWDITRLEMLEYIAKKNKPVILATWASTLSEVDEAIHTIESTWNKDIVLLQCITNYPSKPESANINVLKTYQVAFNILTWYSDHSPWDTVILWAVALWANVIEKHFTLDKSSAWPDHPHSMDPKEFKEMVQRTRVLEKALGSTRKFVVEEESETVIVQRRWLYATRDINVWEDIKKEDIIELRPALGISPKHKKDIIGCIVKKTIKEWEPIYWENINYNK